MIKHRFSQFQRLILIAFILVMSFNPNGAVFAAASMTVQPITWNVIGLDSNDISTGPEDFPVGVRACNPDTTFTFTDVEADFVWLDGGTQTDDSLIRLRPGSLNPIQPSPQVDLAPGECHDFYFEVELERNAAAYDQTRRYRIDVTYFDPDLGIQQTVSTPTPREIYVERLVSQNRNSVIDVQLANHTGDCATASYTSVPVGGTMNLFSGSSYCIRMVGSTATNGYEQIETFTNFPNTIFLINSVAMTYSAHTGSDPDYLTKLYSDACTWNNDPNDVTAPTYRECIGTGKDGGDITVVYDITIIATSDSGALNSLIYDFSGSSYHYNNDFDETNRNFVILDPSACTQETIAAWDFDTSLSDPSVDNAAGTPSISTAGISAASTYNSGNPGDALAHSGWPTGALSTSDYIQFNVSTEGYFDINFSYDINRSSQGPANVTPAYDDDGSGTTTLLTVHDLPEQNTWYSHSENLSAITSMDNASGARFVLYGHDAGNSSGDLRFDNVEITGCKLPATLNLAKTADPGTYTAAGQTITYTYTLINAGEVALYAPYTITDDKVAAVDIDCSLAASPLAPGASTTCTGTYITTDADVVAGSITNNAIANATSAIGESVTSNTATRTIYLAAMNLVKSLESYVDADGSGDVSEGDTLTYRFVVTNTGTANLTNVSISDPLPGLSALSCTPAQPADLAPGETLDCTATYVVTAADVAAGSISNTATASSDQTPDDTDSVTVPVNVSEDPGISVTKEFDPNNGIVFISPTRIRLTYIITVENTGNVPLSNVQVVDNLVDTFPSPATFTLQGTPTCGNLTCNSGFNGDTDTNLLTGSDTLGVGAIGTIRFIVLVDTGGKAENYTNIAEGSGYSPAETRVSDIGSITGPNFADPALTKAVDPTRASIGDLVTFTIVVYNNGTQVAPNVVVTDPLPDNLDHVSTTSVPRGTVSLIPPRTVMVDLGDLGVDEVITITIVTRVNGLGNPPVENVATLTTDSPTDQPSNNEDQVVIQIVAEPQQLPSTGFAPSVVTTLPEQTADQSYAYLGPVWLEIPNLGVKTSIVGIPRISGNWNVDWLWQQAGWLQGTAFPTWTGNSVVTGHAYLPNGLPGPFVDLAKLRWGNQVIVHMYGEKYIYEVRTNHIVMPNDTSVLKHEDRAWLTLLTCRGYDEAKGLYKYRIATRAVLMRVESEP